MKKISKLILSVIIGIFFLGNLSFSGALVSNVSASSTGISLIPLDGPSSECKGLLTAFAGTGSSVGEFNFEMIGCYFRYLIDIFSKIAVMISFLFVLIGSFRYTITYLEGSDDGKNAKNTVINALKGLAISTLAYVIVDVFIRFLL